MAEQDPNEAEANQSEGVEDQETAAENAVDPAAADRPELTLAQLQEQLDTAKEQVLRAAAETQNARRRAEPCQKT